MLLAAVLTLMLLAAFAPARALSVAVPPVAPLLPFRMVVSDATIPIRLDRVQVRTEINGGLAQTRIELTFFNPNARQLEGELQFPLAPGQTVTGMAMDFDGVLRDAVPVEKAKGQEVFEDVTRQRVDPALLQVSEGNNFRLRVYPLLPQQNKTVVLRIGEQLAGPTPTWSLPLVYAGRVGTLDFEATVCGMGQAPVTGGLLKAAKTVAQPQGKGGQTWQVRLDQKDARLDSAANMVLAPAPEPVTLTESFDGETFFYAQPRLPGATVARALPTSVTLLWDSSGSGAERDHSLEFGLLDALFRQAQNMRVNLVRFRDMPEPPQSFTVSAGNWSALRQALENVAYDGATRLPNASDWGSATEVLLFGDGLENFGTRTSVKTILGGWSGQLYTINAAHKRNANRLQALAEATGGRFIDLLQSSPQAAAAALLQRGPRVVSVSGDGVEALVLASRYPQNGSLRIAGKLRGASGLLRLRIAGADGSERDVQVPVGNGPAQSVLAARLWAQLSVDALDAEYNLNRAAIKRLGQRFGLVTRETSLIILDTAADYARYEVEPPAPLRAEVERLRSQAQSQRTTDRNNQLERVLHQFQEKQAWWNTNFPKYEKPVPLGVKPGGPGSESEGVGFPLGSEEAGPGALVHPSPQPASAPAPAPTAPAAAMAGNRMQSELSLRGRIEKAAGSAPEPSIGIQLKGVSSDAAWARRMREADAATRYRIYMDERPSWTNSTAFFLDAADIFFDKGERALALRVLGNLAEMDLENRHILRVLGYRLIQAQEPELAVPLFEKVLELSPNEPQSWRDLGLALAATGQTQKAVDALWEVVSRPWSGRFPGVELIALAELNAVVATAPTPPNVSAIDPRLRKNLPLDVRAVLTWDADNTDIDLWVTDPDGDKAFYGHPLTRQGGRMSPDFTGGYGPEEFSLKDAKPGTYTIEAQFFGHRQQVVATATTLQVTLQTRFGTAKATEKRITLRLKGVKEQVFVGQFEVPAK